MMVPKLIGAFQVPDTGIRHEVYVWTKKSKRKSECKYNITFSGYGYAPVGVWDKGTLEDAIEYMLSLRPYFEPCN